MLIQINKKIANLGKDFLYAHVYLQNSHCNFICSQHTDGFRRRLDRHSNSLISASFLSFFLVPLMRRISQIFIILLMALQLSACVVVSVADTLVSTTVKVGGAVVGTAVDVTQAGVHAVTGSSDNAETNDDNSSRKKPSKD